MKCNTMLKCDAMRCWNAMLQRTSISLSWDTIQCDGMQYDIIRYDMRIRHEDMIRYNTIRSNGMRWNAMEWDVMQWNKMEYDVMLCSAVYWYRISGVSWGTSPISVPVGDSCDRGAFRADITCAAAGNFLACNRSNILAIATWMWSLAYSKLKNTLCLWFYSCEHVFGCP